MAAEDEIQDNWFSLTANIGGEEYFGLRGIEYGDKLTREQVYGASPFPLGKTPGKVENDEGKLTLLNKEFYALLAKFGDAWGDKSFEITVQYGMPGTPVHTDVIEGCHLAGANGGGSEGTNAIEREIPFTYLAVKRDGKYITRRRQRRA